MTQEDRDLLMWEFGCSFPYIHASLKATEWHKDEVVGMLSTCSGRSVRYHYDMAEDRFTKLTWPGGEIDLSAFPTLKRRAKYEAVCFCDSGLEGANKESGSSQSENGTPEARGPQASPKP